MKICSILELITIKVALLLSITGPRADSLGYHRRGKCLEGEKQNERTILNAVGKSQTARAAAADLRGL